MRVQAPTDEENRYNGSMFHNGFRFHRKYVGKKSCTFWCAHNRSRDSPCTYKIKVNNLGVIVDQSGKHHDTCIAKAETSRSALGFTEDLDQQDLTINVTERMLNRAEELALKHLSMPPKKIHLQVLQEIKEKHNVFRGATNHKIINRIKNARSKLNGNDMYRTVEMDHLARIKDSDQFFMHFNITFPNDWSGKYERIMGFGNPSLFRIFGGNKRVFIDGTFKIVPKPFYQCLIVMVFDEQTDKFVPVFYILLTSKKEQIYRHALYLVKSTVGSKINPASVTCDFEKALHNAVRMEFPTSIINGCLFHWKQAIYRKVISLKFDEPVIDRFKDRKVFEQLTLIPPNEIRKYGIPYVREIMDYELSNSDMKKMEIFWEYFENFWLSSPSFIYSWNVNHHPPYLAKKMMRTNNGLERYNRRVSELFQQSKPSLINFIETLELESRNQLDELDDIRKGLVINRKRKRDGDSEKERYNEISVYYHQYVEKHKKNKIVNPYLK